MERKRTFCTKGMCMTIWTRRNVSIYRKSDRMNILDHLHLSQHIFLSILVRSMALSFLWHLLVPLD
jgi:hypothetical protein